VLKKGYHENLAKVNINCCNVKHRGLLIIKEKYQQTYLPAGKFPSAAPEAEILLIADHCPDVLWSYNLEKKRWNYISPSVKRLTGYNVEEAMKLSLEQLFSPVSYHFFVEQAALRLEHFLLDESKPQMNRDEVELICKDGSAIWCDVTSQCIRNEKGELTLTGVARSCLEEGLEEEGLRSALAKYRDIFNSIEEGYYETDLYGRLTFFNDASTRMCGYTRTEFASIDYRRIFKDPREAFQRFNQVYLSGIPDKGFTTEIKRKDGSYTNIELSISPMFDHNGTVNGFRGLVREVNERVLFQKQLEYYSMHDQLTGLYNRNYFEEEMRKLSKSRDYPITMISADVNGLKLINDTMGHEHGDRLLRTAAQVLKNSLRGSDVLARVGGDEFSAILLKTDEIAADKVVARIRGNVKKYNAEYPELYLSLSLGTATAQDNETSMNEIFKRADDKMYSDKYSPGSRARGKIVKSLLAALEKRDYIADGHSKRLSLFCRSIGKKVGLSRRQLANLALLAQIHDLGKVAIPDQILFKETPLSEKEWQIIKEHPEKGYRIALSSNYLTGVAGLILKHHERWDGSGYPLGLKGREIPLECRILAIADAYDAMTSQRVYNRRKTKMEALEELRRCSGSQFDPEMVEEFIMMIEKKEGD